VRCMVQVVIESEAGQEVQQVACLERDTARPEEIGLTLAEAKSLLAGLQKALVNADHIGRGWWNAIPALPHLPVKPVAM
jgi:hypothetical protein